VVRRRGVVEQEKTKLGEGEKKSGGQNCSSSDLIYCNQNMAAIAFAWIEWIIMTVALVSVILIGSAALRRGDRLSSGLV
jgi:hypothetical protein